MKASHEKSMEFLLVPEVAEILRASVKTVRLWLEQGKLKGVKMGKSWRVSRADLEAFAQVDSSKAVSHRRNKRQKNERI